MSSAEPVMCANRIHEDLTGKQIPAITRVSWPDGRFEPTTVCRQCPRYILDDFMSGDPDWWRPILIEPVTTTP